MSKVEITELDHRGHRDVYREEETWRLLEPQRHQTPEERRQERWWDETEKLLERMDLERAADTVEKLSADYVDFRGFPLPGFESPRFLSEREREYKRWYRGSSPDAAHVRRIREDGA